MSALFCFVSVIDTASGACVEVILIVFNIDQPLCYITVTFLHCRKDEKLTLTWTSGIYHHQSCISTYLSVLRTRFVQNTIHYIIMYRADT